MAHGWLLLLTPVAAEVLGRCALQRHATRTRPLILEEHGASGNWSYVLDSCQRLVERLVVQKAVVFMAFPWFLA